MKNLVALVTLAFCLLSLTACVPVAVTAVGATAIYERHSIKQHLSDHDISFHIDNAIFGNKHLYGSNHIINEVVDGNVLLVGQVLNSKYKQEVINIAKKTPGVKRIYDQLMIGKPTSFWRQTQDTFISTKIRTQLLSSSKAGSGATVTTENGVVYLMGTVTPEQAKACADIARTTSGVKKVVTIFQYSHQKSESHHH